MDRIFSSRDHYCVGAGDVMPVRFEASLKHRTKKDFFVETVCVCVRAYVRACVRASVPACVCISPL